MRNGLRRGAARFSGAVPGPATTAAGGEVAGGPHLCDRREDVPVCRREARVQLGTGGASARGGDCVSGPRPWVMRPAWRGPDGPPRPPPMTDAQSGSYLAMRGGGLTVRFRSEGCGPLGAGVWSTPPAVAKGAILCGFGIWQDARGAVHRRGGARRAQG